MRQHGSVVPLRTREWLGYGAFAGALQWWMVWSGAVGRFHGWRCVPRSLGYLWVLVGEAALARLGLGLPWFTGGLLVVAVVGVVSAGLVGSGDWGSLVVAGFGAGIPGGGVVV